MPSIQLLPRQPRPQQEQARNLSIHYHAIKLVGLVVLERSVPLALALSHNKSMLIKQFTRARALIDDGTQIQVKCNAVKPACAACLKSASAQGRPLEEVNCEYDDESTVTKKASRKSTGPSTNNNNIHNNVTTKTSSSSSSSYNGITPGPDGLIRMSDNGMASIEKQLKSQASSKRPSPYNGASSKSRHGTTCIAC